MEKQSLKCLTRPPVHRSEVGYTGLYLKISTDRCVKIYVKPRHAKREQESLRKAKELPFVPKLYEYGENYTVMEYVVGVTLKKYLKAKGYVPYEIAKAIMDMLLKMEEKGFTKLDTPLRHTILTPNGECKLIDHVNSYHSRRTAPLVLFAWIR